MNDYLTSFESYKSIKEISDLIDDIKKLREYYNAQQYDEMQQHIKELMRKYPVEVLVWNISHPVYPTTMQQAYLNAEEFLRMKGISVLIKNGIKLQEKLSAEECAFVEAANMT